MTQYFHAIVFATCLAATAAVGLASAATFHQPAAVAPKSDRLASGGAEVGVEYLIVETRKNGVSVLSRLTLGDNI
jgi:hypothetical protein